MATSGYKDITVTKNHYIRFSWSLKSQSVANNTSSVAWNMKLVADKYGYMESSTAKSWSVTVNGSKYSGTVNITHDPGATLTLASGTTTITHNADGTKSFNYSFTQNISITYAGSPIGSFTGSGSGTLTTIPRASTISATNAYIESASTITITRASSSFTHTLQYKIGSQTSYTTIVSKTKDTSYKWTIPTAAYSQVGSTGKTVSIVIKCITYNGSTNIGEKTKTITATCNASKCNPTLAPIIEDAGKISTVLTGDPDKVIKYYNNISYKIGATAKNGASIKSQKITVGTKSATAATGEIGYVDSNVFTITATDSRGFTSTTKVTKTLINYVKVTCNLSASATLDNSTNTATVKLTISGNWFNGSFGAMANAITVQYRYKTNSGSYGSWTSVTATKSGNTYKATKSITGLDYGSTFTIEARAYDTIHTEGASNNFGLVTTGAKTVSAKPVFDWSKTDFQFNVPINAMSSKYYSPLQDDKGTGGLNMNNSDIVKANGIFFADAADSAGEGLFFYNSKVSGWDVLYAHQGKLYFKPEFTSSSATAYTIFYAPGDTTTIGDNTPFFGYLTNSKKSLIVTIPINKPVIATGCTISGNLQMRSVSGYLYNQASNKTEKTTTFKCGVSTAEGITTFNPVITKTGMIRLEITFSAALTANAAGTTSSTNNAPVILVPDGNLTITFK